MVLFFDGIYFYFLKSLYNTKNFNSQNNVTVDSLSQYKTIQAGARGKGFSVPT